MNSEVRAAAVVLAGGSGRRVGNATNKVLLPLLGRPILDWSLATLAGVAEVIQVVVVVRPDDVAAVRPLLGKAELVLGGAERHDSEWNALQVLAPTIDAGELDVVAIHDGARPLAPAPLWRAVISAAQACGGALPVVEQHGLVRRDGTPAPALVGVQTPQAFRATDLLHAYRHADSDGFRGTDTASCLERYTDIEIRAVAAPASNLKVTFADDLARAEQEALAAGVAYGPEPA